VKIASRLTHSRADMRVLITGASGRIGRAIYARLALEYEVVGIDRAPSSTANVVGEITDLPLLRRALRGVDAIVHTAALHAPHVGLVSDAEFERVNVIGTQILAEMAIEHGISRFVFTSTTALYGKAATPPNRAGWVDEKLKPRPVTIYHATKIAAEDLLNSASQKDGLSVTILRVSRCFPEPANAMAVYRLHRGIDARDIADAHARSLAAPLAGSRTFLISGATPFLPEDAEWLVQDAPAVLRRRAPALVEAFERRSWSLPSSIDRVYTPAHAAIELGWRPRYGYQEVLKMFDEQSPEILHACSKWTVQE
jgi:UDP-glucose 4-epimerase